MNAEPDRAPLKVCPHCSVASRTADETCPNCGRSYVRRRPTLRWSWWLAIPIVALAFAVGYFGSREIRGDEEAEPSGLTIEEARGVPATAAPPRVERLLDGQNPDRVKRSSGGGNELVCRLYEVVDRERTAWEFCFLDGALEISRAHRF